MIFAAKTIYMVFNLVCYAKRGCQECCCNTKCCFFANKVVHASISLCMAIEVIVFTGIVYG